MDLKILTILVVLTPLASTVDFSQFYLPQCCYVPNSAASEQSPTYVRHDIKIRKPAPSDPDATSASPESQEIKSKIDTAASSSNKKSEKKITARLYRYIIPMKASEMNDAGENSSEEVKEGPPPPPPGMREKGNAMRKSLRMDIKHEALHRKEDQLLSSHPEIESELAPANASKTIPSVESLLFDNKTLETMLKHKRNTATPSPADSKELQDFNSNRKMPSSWLTNLRRALYQSMDSLINAQRKQGATTTATADETIEAKSSNHNPNPSSSNEIYQAKVTELWDSLRGANLTLVEALTRSATELPENIYLPAGDGPIASGVVVNTVNGIQLRMASELYFEQDEPDRDPSASSDNNCNCHLINNGEMLMAYWAVSRIMNENGQPALQYLIYPLPHNVPTPPRMIPFNQYTFNPSLPYNPNLAAAAAASAAAGNHHRKLSKAEKHQLLAQQQQQQFQLQQQQQQQQFAGQFPQGQLGHVTQLAGGLPQNYEAGIPQLQELPVDPNQHGIHPQQPTIPQKYQNIFDSFQYFTQIPQSPVQQQQQHHHHQQQIDNRGVLIQNQQGYTPEFVNLYKQTVNQHLSQQQQQHHHQPEQQIHQQLLPQIVSQQPTHGPPPPAHVQLFDGKNSNGFPKSIQDILSPAQQPQLGPGGQLPSSFLPGQVHSLGGFQHIPAAAPPTSQEFHGLNYHRGQQLQEALHPHKVGDVVNYYSFDHNPPDGNIIPTYSTKIIDHHPDQHLQYHNADPPYLGGGGGGGNPFASQNPFAGDRPGQSYPVYRPTHLQQQQQQQQLHHHQQQSGNRFAGSIHDDYRHHHRTQQQPLPTRHRSEKYGRPTATSNNNKQFSSEGSYIINF